MKTYHGRITMKRILGTMLFLAFMAGTLFSGLACGPKEVADDAAGSGDTTTPAEETEEEIEEVPEGG